MASVEITPAKTRKEYVLRLNAEQAAFLVSAMYAAAHTHAQGKCPAGSIAGALRSAGASDTRLFAGNYGGPVEIRAGGQGGPVKPVEVLEVPDGEPEVVLKMTMQEAKEIRTVLGDSCTAAADGTFQALYDAGIRRL